MNDQEWPAIELCPVKQGILCNFSPSCGEIVANVLVKELDDRLDQPTPSAADNFTNEDLEWIMQVINHGLTLGCTTAQR